jgi:hypothetical protein
MPSVESNLVGVSVSSGPIETTIVLHTRCAGGRWQISLIGGLTRHVDLRNEIEIECTQTLA